jgi:hypothetical protein
MNEQKIQYLLTALFNLKYDWKSSGSSYKSEVINKDGKLVVEDIIRKFLLDNRDEKQGVLEAKVFMYEQIISKSNFAPMLEKAVEEKEEKD